VITLPGIVLQRLIEENRLIPLQHSLLPNLSYLDDHFRTNAFDPDQAFSVPYLWSTAGIAYNFARLDFTPHSWGRLFHPGSNALTQLRGRISLLPDAALAVSPALIHLGYAPNTTNAAALTEAAEFLRQRAGDLGLQFMAIPPGEGLLTEDILVAECFGGDIADIIRRDPQILFAVPEDGTWERMEFLVITRESDEPTVVLAHALINYLLDFKVAGAVSSSSFQGTTVTRARAFVDSGVKNGPAYAKAPHGHLQKMDRESDRLRERILESLMANSTNANVGTQ
jgi:spermidine/putrescine transport system substrate-binding protein